LIYYTVDSASYNLEVKKLKRCEMSVSISHN
jgi:hypothetical protein